MNIEDCGTESDLVAYYQANEVAIKEQVQNLTDASRGKCLWEIKESGKWTGRWDVFCKEKLGLSRSHVNNLISFYKEVAGAEATEEGPVEIVETGSVRQHGRRRAESNKEKKREEQAAAQVQEEYTLEEGEEEVQEVQVQETFRQLARILVRCAEELNGTDLSVLESLRYKDINKDSQSDYASTISAYWTIFQTLHSRLFEIKGVWDAELTWQRKRANGSDLDSAPFARTQEQTRHLDIPGAPTLR